MKNKVGIIDYGSGNYASVRNAVSSLSPDFIEVRHPDDLNLCTHIILPGVGAYHAAMEKLHSLGFINPLRLHVLEKNKPFLGICVGMQILSTVGTEFQECEGLNFIKGVVKRFDFKKDITLPLPHIGWNEVYINRDNPLFKDIESNETFYFVHSYHFVSKDEGDVIAKSDYGYPFVSSIQRDNIYGVQFHPEKSQINGIKLLRNFIDIDYA